MCTFTYTCARARTHTYTHTEKDTSANASPSLSLHNLVFAKEVGARAGEGATYGNLGIACGLHGDFSKTIENHAQDLASAKEVGDRAGEGQAYGNLGTCHMHLNEYFNAVAYFEAQHPHPSSWQVARPWHQPRGDATFHTSSRVCSWR